MRFAPLLLLAALSTAEAQTFECTPTLTRVLVRAGENWKETQTKTAGKLTLRELHPDERRSPNRTWGLFLNGGTSPASTCTKYENVLTCGVPGNTVDFNTRTGRYVQTFFASFLSRDSSELFIEAGRCSETGP